MSAERDASLLAFFLLTYALAVPFWVFGALSAQQLMPGLPVAALMFVCPGLAASILVTREQGFKAVKSLLARALDYKGVAPKFWYAPLLLLNPAIFILSYFALRALGTPVPAPQILILPTLALCVVFFVSAFGEELGWSGYAVDSMQCRWGALRASLMLGGIWAMFHFVALAQAHRSVEWITWWSLWTVAQRVVMVLLYNGTRKNIFAVILAHASSNVCWQLFPIRGTFFDPRVTGLITALVAMVAIALWKRAGRSAA
ncbi:MAG: type II CAAX prenyl endopeptidase Rce1 family protein [Steroidobacteraceae bacterium]